LSNDSLSNLIKKLGSGNGNHSSSNNDGPKFETKIVLENMFGSPKFNTKIEYFEKQINTTKKDK
jgi:hypothetical protein